MVKHWSVVIALLFALAYGPTVAQDDSPPPLGFASITDYPYRYHVFDFQSGTVQTIERDEGIGEKQAYYDPLPAAEITLQSPYDASINFVFVSTEPIEPNTYIERTLYRLASDGTRQFVTAHADVPYPAENYWSPNGKYLYIMTDAQPEGTHNLNRLDLITNQLTPLKNRVYGINNCQTDTGWCIINELGVRNDDEYPMTLYLMNRDDGTLQTLGTSVLIFTNVMWLGSEFLYAIATSVNQYAIHHYDAATHADKLLAVIEAIHIDRWQVSADSRWLLMEATLSQEVYGGLYVLDLTTSDAKPILLTDQFTHISQSPVPSLRWLDDHNLIYATYTKYKGRTIYKATFPDGTISELAHFDRDVGFFDHDWSPDGHWLVLSQYLYNKTPATIYLVSAKGETREITLQPVDDQSVCVGWFTNETYLSQKANICDMTLGEG